MTFYNAISLSGDDLDKAIAQANSQKKKILAFFEANLWRTWTSHQVHEAFRYMGYNWPYSSVVRALSDLGDGGDGPIEKTSMTRMGPYGKPCHLWRLKPTAPVQGSLF